MPGSCKSCRSCNADPYIINDGCETCFRCENQEGHLRFRDDKKLKELRTKKLVISVLAEAARRLHDELDQEEKMILEGEKDERPDTCKERQI